MISSIVRPVVGALGAMVIVCAGHAQDVAKPSLLTREIVENIMTSYPEVKAKVNELRLQYDVDGDLSDAAAWRAWAEVGGAKSQLDAVVQPYGFADFPTWVRTLSVTAQAYAFTHSGDEIDRKMAEAIVRVKSDPNLSEGQKEMMQQQLRHSADVIAAMKPSQASIDAVTPYAAQLGKLFDKE